VRECRRGGVWGPGGGRAGDRGVGKVARGEGGEIGRKEKEERSVVRRRGNRETREEEEIIGG